MRDPNRIDEFCDTLKEAWHKAPDWRFMQFVCNLQRSIGNDGFYLEDEALMEIIKNLFK